MERIALIHQPDPAVQLLPPQITSRKVWAVPHQSSPSRPTSYHRIPTRWRASPTTSWCRSNRSLGVLAVGRLEHHSVLVPDSGAGTESPAAGRETWISRNAGRLNHHLLVQVKGGLDLDRGPAKCHNGDWDLDAPETSGFKVEGNSPVRRFTANPQRWRRTTQFMAVLAVILLLRW